jgi:hypothetical protein
MSPERLPLPQAELDQLEQLLGQIITNSINAHDEAGAWCLRYSRNRALQGDAPILQRIGHYFSDFNAFRDDAHMAAWQAQGVEAHAWEAFALVATGLAETAVSVYEALFFRGHSIAEYGQGLAESVQRGWLTQDGDRFTLTEAGRQTHQTIEQATDAYFYAPWHALGNDQLAQVVSLLQKLQDALQQK